MGINASLALCKGATDDSRAMCITNAPSYLSQPERVSLCQYQHQPEVNNTDITALSCMQSFYLSCKRISSLLYVDRTYSFSATPTQTVQRNALIELCSRSALVNSLSTSASKQLSAVRFECLKRAMCDVSRPPHANPTYNTFGTLIVIIITLINNFIFVFVIFI